MVALLVGFVVHVIFSLDGRIRFVTIARANGSRIAVLFVHFVKGRGGSGQRHGHVEGSEQHEEDAHHLSAISHWHNITESEKEEEEERGIRREKRAVWECGSVAVAYPVVVAVT